MNQKKATEGKSKFFNLRLLRQGQFERTLTKIFQLLIYQVAPLLILSKAFLVDITLL